MHVHLPQVADVPSKAFTLRQSQPYREQRLKLGIGSKPSRRIFDGGRMVKVFNSKRL